MEADTWKEDSELVNKSVEKITIVLETMRDNIFDILLPHAKEIMDRHSHISKIVIRQNLDQEDKSVEEKQAFQSYIGIVGTSALIPSSQVIDNPQMKRLLTRLERILNYFRYSHRTAINNLFWNGDTGTGSIVFHRNENPKTRKKVG